MKRFICVLLSLATLTALISTSDCTHAFVSTDKNIYSYLLVGIDDSGNNTDSLSVLSYNANDNHISVLQIPRDTYFNFGFYQNKINQYYPKMISEGKDAHEALSALAEAVGEALSINLKGYIAASSGAFINFIDSLGGVKIEIENDFAFFDDFRAIGVDLELGENVLSGESALKFVRHRSGYSGGDLTRLDVQKIFFSGLFSTVYRFVTDEGAHKLFNSAKENITSNLSVIDIILMVIKHSSKFKSVEFMYFTLPGRAFKIGSGLWYYQVNMPSSVNALTEYLDYQGAFDPCGSLINLKEIYYDNKINYKVYYSKVDTEK